MKKHLLVDLSSHGYGHFSQTAPIINLLGQHHQSLKITLRTTLPEKLIRSRIHIPLRIIPESLDFGMKMNSAIETDVAASNEAYTVLHQNWTTHIATQKRKIQALEPDLLFANIPYLSLAAANELALTSVALCSLNWAHIYNGYFSHKQTQKTIYQQMLAAYNSANVYLYPEPSMDMPGLKRIKKIPPIANVGNNRRIEINKTFQLNTQDILVLIAPGGISTAIPIETWPQVPGIHWLTTWEHSIKRKDIISYQKINMDFTDILCSADVIISKPGYGLIVEAVCNQKPVLYVRRYDWPEEQNLVDWLQQKGISKEISKEAFFNGNIVDEIKKIIRLKPTVKIEPNGAKKAAEIIGNLL